MLRHYSVVEDLPSIVPVFPLTGAVLLPRGELPLNIFESRYLAMVDAALAGARIIGMIQPTQHEDNVLTPALAKVGCAGRITNYRETDDRRVLITLNGVCRFRVAEELVVKTPYRQIRPDYSPFAADLVSETAGDFPRERLLGALKTYLSKRDMKADWRSVMEAPPEMLVNVLAMACPFEPAEKQALVEAPSWSERLNTLLAILEMSLTPLPENRSLN